MPVIFAAMTRDVERLAVIGTVANARAGDVLTPMVKLTGQDAFVAGRPVIVDDSSSFTWYDNSWWGAGGFSWRLVRTTPAATVGLVLAHAGLGFTTAGIATMTSFAAEKILVMRPGETAVAGPVSVTMLGAEEVEIAVDYCGLCHSDLSVIETTDEQELSQAVTPDVAAQLTTSVTVIHYCHDAASDSNGKAQEKVNPVGLGCHLILQPPFILI